MIRNIIMTVSFTMILNGKDYAPNWNSIDSRETPEWFKDAKFGIFIHWGLYSVPAWGPKGSYAEWYLSGLNNGDTARLRYHHDNYGKDFPYWKFIDLFRAENYDPDKWASIFKKSGAKYVVLTSKHHDGFCLWPSKESKGYNSVSGAAGRDLLGELNGSLKKVGLKSGLYYSLYEWEHPDYPENISDYVDNYMLPQFKDVVQRYKPDIIFSDGEWDRDSQDWKSEQFLAWLYNESNAPKDVVVNDRWGGETRFKHGGYFSTEYDPSSEQINEEFINRGWEECRGMGKSFGFNRNEEPEDYSTSEELIRMLVDIVSRGGNLLLNIGPRSDGTIPEIMINRLNDIGLWLEKNGEAIFGTTISPMASSEKVRFTLSKNRRYLFAFVNQIPKGKLLLKGISGSGNEQIVHLGKSRKLNWRNVRGDLVIDIPKKIYPILGNDPVHVFKIPVLPYLSEPSVEIVLDSSFADVTIISEDRFSKLEYAFGNNTDQIKKYTRYDGPFRVHEPGILNFRATKQERLPSKTVSVPIEILNDQNGLFKKTYSGEWENCDEMINGELVEESTSIDFSIDEFRKNNFGHSFSGYLQIDKDGTYEFQTSSDDGSRLFINGFPVVDNDGLHGRQVANGNVPLKIGLHEIRLDYFERGGQQSLEVKWKGPGFDWRTIPSFMLFKKIDHLKK